MPELRALSIAGKLFVEAEASAPAQWRLERWVALTC